MMVGLCAIGASIASAQTPGPIEAIKSFSDFQQVDVNRLLAGDILVQRGSLMSFPNGISGQTCFAVPLSAEETAKRLQTWDPLPHRELKVYAFHSLHAPCEAADFAGLNFKSSEHSIRWLLDKTMATTASKSELNLAKSEAGQLGSCPDKRSDQRKLAECWVRVLLDRATAFQQKGLAGVLPYEAAGYTASPADQLRKMVSEQLPIAHEFFPLLKQIGLMGDEATPQIAPFYYWTLFDADHHGTISLGGVYLLAVGDHYQLADVQYYVNANYFTSITLYEVWPIESAGKPAALVWRADYFAAPMLAFTKGTERIAYGALMMQDIKKEIRYFEEDVKEKR